MVGYKKHLNSAIRIHQTAIAFGVPLLVIVGMIILAGSSLFKLNSAALSVGITFDLVITAPLIYIVLIRKSKIPKITVCLFFILGITIASLIIPVQHQSFLDRLKIWLIPAVETVVLILVIVKMRDLYRSYQMEKRSVFDFYSALKEATRKLLLGAIHTILAFEIATFYYGFVHWKKVALKENEFSYHRKSSSGIVLGMIIFLVLAETFVLHLLVRQWNENIALILSAISIYTALQVFGMARSLGKRPIAVESRNLKLRFGIMAETTIPMESIDSIELSSKNIAANKHVKKLSPLGDLDATHNILIHLRSENVLYGLYGIRETYRSIAFHVDDKEDFIKTLNQVRSATL